jgi:hypothetical protein
MKQSDRQRLPFQYEQPEVVPTRELKLKPKVSEEKQRAKSKEQHQQELQERFDKLADQVTETQADRRQTAFDLAKQFITSARDRTLPTNKGVVAQDVETEMRRNLIAFATEINNDANEPLDCMGSMAVFNLLIKTIFEQRDRINELEYQIVQVDKKLRSSTASSEPSRNE